MAGCPQPRTVPARDWPSRLPVSRRVGHLTGDDVEAALRALFEQHGRSCRFHFVCGARCFGKACHGQALVDLAALILDDSAEPPFAKELKITVPEAMNDLAVLMHVSYLTGGRLPVIQIATDGSDFFNQHRLHPCEVPRVGLVTLSAGAAGRELSESCPREGVLGPGRPEWPSCSSAGSSSTGV